MIAYTIIATSHTYIIIARNIAECKEKARERSPGVFALAGMRIFVVSCVVADLTPLSGFRLTFPLSMNGEGEIKERSLRLRLASWNLHHSEKYHSCMSASSSAPDLPLSSPSL